MQNWESKQKYTLDLRPTSELKKSHKIHQLKRFKKEETLPKEWDRCQKYSFCFSSIDFLTSARQVEELIEQDQKILKLIMNVMNILSVIVLTGIFSVAYNAYISKMFMFIWIKTNFDWMLSVMQIKTLAEQVSHCHWFEAQIEKHGRNVSFEASR